MHIKQVMGGARLHVRTCISADMAVFRISETTGPMALIFGVWLKTHYLFGHYQLLNYSTPAHGADQFWQMMDVEIAVQTVMSIDQNLVQRSVIPTR